MEYAIHVTNLCKAYQDFALDNVSFAVPKGCIMGFIGENGAGKSTMIKAMLNLVHRDAGKVEILGMDLDSHEKEIKERIGVVFDECCFHDNLTPADISKILGNIYQNWDGKLYQTYLVRFGLGEKKKIKEFSRGMKMKLGIAAALAHNPDVLILDEATSGLDPIVREEILDIFLDFIQDENHAVLISSHITSDLDKIADYLTFIHHGRVVFSTGRDELMDSMGVVKCGTEDLAGIGKDQVIRYRKNQFGCEVLIRDKRIFAAGHPGAVIDPVTTESIMLFYSRGEEL
ncbi:ABC transporter ATP-binding protein [Methanocorpusculum vombati]|uniref:ABC transporter ATP-binding protein n=1 Tax=Methanocorpusculum vombati TaxID=3002864 RepID=A0ABT4IMP9_9EURY|nr:ABC transporter ATP-binding protein [Methanocorpusculum vombati]MCZ9318870.1 ABC transporter ATP-binding protein [Methanocorpusculum sp.]MCZ0863033.1 ABC transporter ATP-binding protein [Methanocorpusculum vombati]MDE2520525.1 ABC transporter ATP-binding protein [Methanocorpusculum sp.]MDE2534605.1 ABC transporter ATP-binding protein [Methanocorpusculum sp.]MDE2546536.1 ABC transporter ATP-binding protein [Methanocorpusculum sp.]